MRLTTTWRRRAAPGLLALCLAACAGPPRAAPPVATPAAVEPEGEFEVHVFEEDAGVAPAALPGAVADIPVADPSPTPAPGPPSPEPAGEAAPTPYEPEPAARPAPTVAAPSEPYYGLRPGGTYRPSGPVRVGGYYRKDGTYVRSHTRSRPGSGPSRSRRR